MSEVKFYYVPFILGIILGIILVYFYKEEKLIIYDYPKPFDNKIYKDKNNSCYQYVTKEVNCNQNEKTLKPYPVQS
jgi:hypothetical protein